MFFCGCKEKDAAPVLSFHDMNDLFTNYIPSNNKMLKYNPLFDKDKTKNQRPKATTSEKSFQPRLAKRKFIMTAPQVGYPPLYQNPLAQELLQDSWPIHLLAVYQ